MEKVRGEVGKDATNEQAKTLGAQELYTVECGVRRQVEIVKRNSNDFFFFIL